MDAKKEKDVTKSNSSISNIEGTHFELPWEHYNDGFHTRVLAYCDEIINKEENKKHQLENSPALPIWMCYFSILGIISQSCLTCEIKSSRTDNKVKEMSFVTKQEINTQKSDFVFYTVVSMFIITIILVVYALYNCWRRPKRSCIYRPAQVTE